MNMKRLLLILVICFLAASCTNKKQCAAYAQKEQVQQEYVDYYDDTYKAYTMPSDYYYAKAEVTPAEERAGVTSAFIVLVAMVFF